jgi:ribosomal protein S12 methylthiotransferase accessory factor
VTSSVLERLEGLVSPFGVIAGAHALQARRGLGDVIDGSSAFFGTPVLHLEDRYSADLKHLREHQWEKAQGFGRAFKDPEDARLKALAEAAERYSSSDFGEPVLRSSYQDLGSQALDPGRIPRCSDRELALPGCPLTSFDPRAQIRWVLGIDLPSGNEIWIPAVMAYYGLRRAEPAEHFWYRISTGFAIHSDPTEALVRGICEVIERDAIAITWLQKLELPLVADRLLPEDVREMISWGHSHFCRYWLFDATTDLAVPTVLCLGRAIYASRLAHTLGCSTGLTIGSAAKKAMLEACFTRRCELATESPDNLADFHSISDGARYMAAPGRWPAFGFLVEDAEDRPALDHPELPGRPEATLATLLATLSGKGMSVIAVDRTTRELADAGLTAVNVVIPELQPMTLHPLAQYRLHPRLYSAPGQMGYPVLPEEELNSWPIPFE